MKTLLIVAGVFLIFCNKINAIGADDCIINIQDLSVNQPLFIRPGGKEFFFPNEYRKISLKSGEQIELYCEKTFKTDSKNQKLLLTCGKDSINNYLECSDRNYETARSMNKKCTYHKNGYLLEIGFNIFDNFLKLIEICYDPILENSVYSTYDLGPYSGSFQMNVAREFFKDGTFHPNLNVSRLYSNYIQRKTLEGLLGTTSTNQYLQGNSLARGHLAAMADFIYAPHQLATFYYVNVGPQWHTFNSGNWELLERDLRKLASKGTYLKIYTGTYGISKLLSDNKIDTELYLNAQINAMKLPVPKLFYKIIIDKETEHGIVIIGVNNPHISEDIIRNEYVICKDIKEEVNWTKLNTNNIKYGYMYACTVPDFVKAVPHMKFVKVKGLLYGKN